MFLEVIPIAEREIEGSTIQPALSTATHPGVRHNKLLSLCGACRLPAPHFVLEQVTPTNVRDEVTSHHYYQHLDMQTRRLAPASCGGGYCVFISFLIQANPRVCSGKALLCSRTARVSIRDASNGRTCGLSFICVFHISTEPLAMALRKVGSRIHISVCNTEVMISSQPDQEGKTKLGRMSGTRAISTTSRRELSSSSFFLQGKASREIHAILRETLTCFLPGRAKDLSAPL